jgi:hypothetical protein
MNRYIRILAALSLAPVMASGADVPRGPYVTQAMVERGVVRFSLPDIGTFLIEEIQRPPGAAAECHVSLRAVAESVEQAIATGELRPAVGARKTVWLKKFVFGDDIVCDEPGSECKAKVFMQSVDVAAVEPM